MSPSAGEPALTGCFRLPQTPSHPENPRQSEQHEGAAALSPALRGIERTYTLDWGFCSAKKRVFVGQCSATAGPVRTIACWILAPHPQIHWLQHYPIDRLIALFPSLPVCFCCCRALSLELSGTKVIKTTESGGGPRGGLLWLDLDAVERRYLLSAAVNCTVAVYDLEVRNTHVQSTPFPYEYLRPSSLSYRTSHTYRTSLIPFFAPSSLSSYRTSDTYNRAAAIV